MHNIVELNIDEQTIGVIRRSLWSEFHRVSLSIVWVLVPFFFFFPLLSFGGFGIFLFVALLASGILFAVKTWLVWRFTMLIVTSERIVDVEQRGFFDRQISYLQMDNVREVVAKRSGIIKRILDIGIIRVKTKNDEEFDLELSGVRHPNKVRDFLDEVQCAIIQEEKIKKLKLKNEDNLRAKTEE
ncbi:MAG: PH domain-containing protein [Candidatus Uhrbacteria bacterium]|nr:PH domain-containing protein [Candidatus Uhrbacteria bacterium]